jgi:hypothetical protein
MITLAPPVLATESAPDSLQFLINLFNTLDEVLISYAYRQNRAASSDRHPIYLYLYTILPAFCNSF